MFANKTIGLFMSLLVFTSLVHDANGNIFKLLKNKRDTLKDSEFVQRLMVEEMIAIFRREFPPKNFHERVDILAGRLLDAAESSCGDIIIHGLGRMIRFDQLVSNKEKKQSKSTTIDEQIHNLGDRINVRSSSGLTDLLTETESNPNIVRRQLTIDSEKFRMVNEAVEYKWSTLPKCERIRLKEALAEADGEEGVVALPRTKRSIDKSLIRPMLKSVNRALELTPSSMKQLTRRIFQVGVKVLDFTFMAPEFFESLPFFGNHIRVLKVKGQPFFELVEIVRHFHYLYKVTQSQDPGTEEDPIKTTRAKQMIGELGVKSIKLLAGLVSDKISKSSLDDDNQQEFISRVTSALFVMVLGEGYHTDKFFSN